MKRLSFYTFFEFMHSYIPNAHSRDCFWKQNIFYKNGNEHKEDEGIFWQMNVLHTTVYYFKKAKRKIKTKNDCKIDGIKLTDYSHESYTILISKYYGPKT